MTYKQQQHLRSLLTDAIVELCRRESFYVEELRIEGTICVVSDRSSVVIAQITEQVGEKFSDAEVDADGVAVDDDNTLPFKSKTSNNGEEDACSHDSQEGEEEEDIKAEEKEEAKEGHMTGVVDGVGLSSEALDSSKQSSNEANNLDDAVMNVGLEVAEQVASIMSIYAHMPKSQSQNSPIQQLSPFFGHSLQQDVFPAADAVLEVDENISLERSANGKFQCPYCIKSYGFKHTLKEHLNKHLGKRPHVCKHCGDTFTHLASLCAHVKRRHDDLMPMDFQCAICQEKLMNYQSLKQHYTWRHKDMKFPEDKIELDLQNSYSTGAATPGCQQEFESKFKPKRRRQSRYRTSFIRPQSDSFVIGEDFCEGQTAVKSIKMELPDEACNSLRLDSSALLEAFERKDYESIQEGIDQSLLENLGLDGSEIRLRGDGMSSAASGLNFPTVESASEPMHYAQMIAKYFDEVHVETEHGLYRYRCRFCRNMFKIRNSLYEHLNSHFGKKPHICSFCGDSFAHHSSLHNHVRNKHSFQTSAEKQASFKHCCLGCERKFRYRSELERHFKCNPDHATSSGMQDCVNSR